jgi:predicted GIY-YIG superfamily endonuclease
MHYVYLLQSLADPAQRYTGLTDDLKARLAKHNQGGVPHTAKFKPWKLVTYAAFSSREQAARFERYLKSGSGRAFANRRLWPPAFAKAPAGKPES